MNKDPEKLYTISSILMIPLFIYVLLFVLSIFILIVLHMPVYPFPGWYIVPGFVVFGIMAAIGYCIGEVTIAKAWKGYELAQKKLEAEKKFNLHKEAALKAGLAPRTDLHIVGPPEFMCSTYRLLDELKDKAPNRYQEVIQYLPQAVYESYLFPSASGTSCGEFSLDGSGNDIGQVNTYERFRFVFLHETGHNVKTNQNHDRSQEEADEYAHQVIRELDRNETRIDKIRREYE